MPPDHDHTAPPVASPPSSTELDAAETEALLRTFTDYVFKNAPDGELVTDIPQWREVTGQTTDEVLGFGWLAGVHPEDRARVDVAWQKAVDERSVFAVEYRIVGPGGEMWVEARSAPVVDEDDEVVRWVGTVVDVTDRHDAAADLARERVLLRQVIERSPIAIAVLWGPEHEFRLFNDGYLDLVPPEHGVAVGVPVVDALPEAAPIIPILDGVLEGEAYEFDELAVPFTGPGAHEGHRYYQGVYAPVSIGGGEPEGILVVATEVTEQVRRRDDLVERVRHEREAAERLQRALLPDEPPDVPGLEIALTYLPAGEDVGVGGDWYDVIDLEDGRVLVVIGDVAGRGLQAAAWMSQVRAAVRAYAVEDPDPGRLLGRCAALIDRLHMPDMISVGCCLLTAGEPDVCWASAGHPAPLLLLPGAPAAPAAHTAGPPLGAGEVTYATSRWTWPEGAALVLYTDGAVEDRVRPLDEGIAALSAACPAVDVGASAIRDVLTAHVHARGDDDDVALLVVRRVPA